jgi:ubiquinone/menaquinone biosynthesis C-methylase UbiE
MSQKKNFTKSEGDKWFDRNKSVMGKSEDKSLSVLNVITNNQLQPTSVLEIGCANGFYLNELQLAFNCKTYGIDPSKMAINEGKKRFPSLNLKVGTSDELNFKNEQFDLIIFGFCLYLSEPKDLFKIAYEADRCLKNEGHILIKDFAPKIPFKNKYIHTEGIYSYKMNYENMFSWHPTYRTVFVSSTSHKGLSLRNHLNEQINLTLLNKNETFAFIDNPYNF